ncbi:MAG: glycosyltransferase family 1 protein, partial [Chthoniobacterales bacterium]
MKILISSHHFLPSLGGIETVTNLLASDFVRRGHEVRVVTQTPGNGSFAFEVVRRPNPGQLVAAVRWSEVFWQNNISLRTIWPLLFIRRPLFITQQTWIASPDGRSHWSHALKRVVLRCVRSFAISRAVAETMPTPSAVIGNPYDETVFKVVPGTARNSDLIFVGRLVSDKGADLFLDALVHLRNSGLRPSATIVG